MSKYVDVSELMYNMGKYGEIGDQESIMKSSCTLWAYLVRRWKNCRTRIPKKI